LLLNFLSFASRSRFVCSRNCNPDKKKLAIIRHLQTSSALDFADAKKCEALTDFVI
jgi:hypothetical protein